MMPRARVCSLRHGAAAVFLDNAGMYVCLDEAEAESFARTVNRFDRRTHAIARRCESGPASVPPRPATDAAGNAPRLKTPLQAKGGGFQIPKTPQSLETLRPSLTIPQIWHRGGLGENPEIVREIDRKPFEA
jgi:hypothetical protein